MKSALNLCVLLVVFNLDQIHAAQVIVPTFTTLHVFSGGSDGAGPRADLILSGGTLYGTAIGGGARYGTVFSVSTNGTDFMTLHTFTGASDGASPGAALLLAGNTLYGTTWGGGTNGSGTVFAVNTNGTDFKVLHTFGRLVGSSGAFGFPTNADGAHLSASLILSSNTLYGTAQVGGNVGQGTLFSLSTNGNGFSILHHFTGGTDGGAPSGGLIQWSNLLYGTGGGRESCFYGTVFCVNTNGTGFTTLHTFPGLTLSTEPWPAAQLVLSGNMLYGTTMAGGSYAEGTVFSINRDGTGFTNLHSFSSLSSSETNHDGANPAGKVTLSSNTLYGATALGGLSATGTLFQLSADGTSFTTLYNFTPSNGPPGAGLLLLGNTLYGTTDSGGNANNGGTVFAISLAEVTSPEIVTQPMSRTNIAGTTATFGVLATGTTPLNFQWFKATYPIPKASTATLILTNVSEDAAAIYSVTISNIAGSVTSAPAGLVVIDRPKLSLARTAEKVVLSWPTAPVTFTLQFTTNLAAPILWSPVSFKPGVINNQNVATNAPLTPHEFFRLDY